MLTRTFTLLMLTLLGTSGLWAQFTRVITDADLVGNQTYNWSKDTIYQLDGYVYLEDGGRLNIEAGTRVEGLGVPSTPGEVSTLIITRGAQIFATGTAAEPIVFSLEGNDDANADLLADRGSWGGLIILGRATISEDNDLGEAFIEGIEGEPRTEYGGGANPIDNDNSGVLRYVSIRFGGAELSPDNEINGLTLGGVGSGTQLSFIEVVANDDDGIEFFGGTANLTYGVVAFCADDSYDTDASWSGRGQFWFSIQNDEDTGNSNPNGGEHDGTESNNDPSGGPVQNVYNATYIGRGASASIAGDNNALTIKSNGAITYNNSIFTEFDDFAISLQDGSADRYVANDFNLAGNIWFGFGNGSTLQDLVQLEDNGGATQAQVIAELVSDGNTLEDPQLYGISYDPDGMLDPRPRSGSPALGGTVAVNDPFFVPTSYRGAFSPTSNWADGWTYLSQQGFFGNLAPSGQTIVVTDSDLLGNTNYIWTPDNTYQLDGFVYLEEGGCLTILPGTRVEGLAVPSVAGETSSLIITQGAKIIANGTADAPIVFSAEGDDDLNADLLADRGSWGGLIILGRASISDDNDTGVANIEGITAEERTEYGGGMNPDDEDDSGILRYVSIRFGGAELSPDNEINGLTLGGVGSGTTLEFIEVVANDDDGIEFFGGTCDLKFGVVAFCADDSYDTDNSWSGRGQFWFSIQNDEDTGNSNPNGGEHDGTESNSDPSGGPVQRVFNATYIGRGSGASIAGDNNALTIKSNGAIEYSNSIFTGFDDFALSLQDGSADRYFFDEFDLSNNIWFDFGNGTTLQDLVQLEDNGGTTQAQVIAELVDDNNTLADPELNGISYDPNQMLDPRPGPNSPARFDALVPDDPFFTITSYRGAFSPSSNWATGWTYLSEAGYFGDLAPAGQTFRITDEDLVGNTIYNWTADNLYQLDGYVYLEEGGVLNIEAGTRIEGLGISTDAGENATLIITQGARINAAGTREAPIVFTLEGDDADADIIADRGAWGGVIVLGRATISEDNDLGVAFIEGIEGEPRTQYGGGATPNDEDDSGVLRYVSIRYGGIELSPDNEINGLTLGGVGSGTELEFIEVFANDDDGIEFFGGTADLKYGVVAFCADDSYDTDASWAGRGQYWFAIQSDDDTGNSNPNGGEHDGTESNNDPSGGPVQVVYNATYIGRGENANVAGDNNALTIKSNGAITYGNSIFTQFDDFAVSLQDGSADRYVANEFDLENNIWSNFGGGTDLTDLVQLEDNGGATVAQVVTALVADGNQLADPGLARLNYDASTNNGADGNGTDPRPVSGSVSTAGAADVPTGDFFDQTTYRGAFDPNGSLWADWTHAYDRGYLVEVLTSVTEFGSNDAGVKVVPSPNPSVGFVQLNIELPATSVVSAQLFDQLGRNVADYNLGMLPAGENNPSIDLSELPNGNYNIVLRTDFGAVSQRIVLNK